MAGARRDSLMHARMSASKAGRAADSRQQCWLMRDCTCTVEEAGSARVELGAGSVKEQDGLDGVEVEADECYWCGLVRQKGSVARDAADA